MEEIQKTKLFYGICETINCLNQCRYGYEYETRCRTHKEENMVSMYPKKTTRLCQEPDCFHLSRYNYVFIKRARFCGIHKKEEMTSKIEVVKGFSPKLPYRVKEKNVVAFVKDTFPDYEWNINKSVKIETYRFVPDIYLEIEDRVLIIEIDEHQHYYYVKVRERERIRLLQMYFDKKMIFIKLNPDDYEDGKTNKRISSCWKKGEICNEEKWNERLSSLENTIKRYLKEEIEEDCKIVHLFYDGYKDG